MSEFTYTGLPYSYEFISEDELAEYNTKEVSRVTSSDGHGFLISSISDSGMTGSIIVSHNDDKEWDERVWRMIQLGPSHELGTRDVAIDQVVRPLIVITGENERHNLMSINDGHVLVEVGYDSYAVMDVKAFIKERTHVEFFNTLAMQMVSYITQNDDGDDDEV